MEQDKILNVFDLLAKLQNNFYFQQKRPSRQRRMVSTNTTKSYTNNLNPHLKLFYLLLILNVLGLVYQRLLFR